MSKGNWLKLHRELQGHWVSEKLEWLAGWVDILMSADWEEGGEICLTSVPAKEKFSGTAWHYFIQRLIDDGMLTDVETVRLGKGKGSRQTARVANWDKYQTRQEAELSNSKHESKQTLNEGLTEPYNPVHDEESGQVANSKPNPKQTLSQTLNVGQYKEYNKEDKELKDFKTIGVSEPENLESQKTEKPAEVEPSKVLTLSRLPSNDYLEPKKTATLQKENSSAATLEWWRETYNRDKPMMWARAKTLNNDRKKAIKKAIKEYGEDEAREMFIGALAHIKTADWWATKKFEIDTVFAENRLLKWSEAYDHSGGLSEANAKLTANAMRWAQAARNVEERRRAQA